MEFLRNRTINCHLLFKIINNLFNALFGSFNTFFGTLIKHISYIFGLHN
jgi:hypothetical protein